MKKTFYLIIYFIILNLFPIYGQNELDIKQPKYLRVAKTYGFIVGQKYSIDLIKENYPQLNRNFKIHEADFNSQFGKAQSGMKSYLKKYFNDDQMIDFEKNLITEIKKHYEDLIINETTVLEFDSELEKRSKGEIPSPILETLLNYQYIENPHQEFLDNFVKIFRTKGHPKSKNTDWQVKIPISWKAKEADRPNIIQKFISDYGDGNQSMMLMVKDLPKNITNQEIKNFFTEKSIRDIVPENGKLISFTKITIDRNSGCMFESEILQENINLKIKTNTVQFMFIRNNKMFSFSCNISSLDDKKNNLNDDMKKFMPLFRLVANSIVVNEQYK